MSHGKHAIVKHEHKTAAKPARKPAKHSGKVAPAGKSGGKSGKTKSANAFSASASYSPLLGFSGSAKYVPDEDAFEPIAYARGPKVHARLRSNAAESANAPNKDLPSEFDELIQVVSGSSDFSVQAFDINPGLADIFPILSQKAKLYQGYVFGSCEIYYCPTISQYQSTGKLMMSCDLEGLEIADPASVSEMENNSIHSDGMPHEYIGFDIAGVTRKRKYYYVREGPIPVGADPRLCDIGRVYVATSGTPTGQVGELRVRGNLILKDVLQPIERFSLPYYVSQTFFDGGQTVVSATQYTATLTDSPPADSSFGQPNPYSNLLPMNLSGWSIDGSNYYVCPANAVYQVNFTVSFVGTKAFSGSSATTLGSFTLMVGGVQRLIMPSNQTSSNDSAANCHGLVFHGSACIPILKGDTVYGSYTLYLGAGGSAPLAQGGVLTIVSM